MVRDRNRRAILVRTRRENTMTSIPSSKCTNRPDCPCDFCVRVRAEIAEELPKALAGSVFSTPRRLATQLR
jgi:hypothetical protein